MRCNYRNRPHIDRNGVRRSSIIDDHPLESAAAGLVIPTSPAWNNAIGKAGGHVYDTHYMFRPVVMVRP